MMKTDVTTNRTTRVRVKGTKRLPTALIETRKVGSIATVFNANAANPDLPPVPSSFSSTPPNITNELDDLIEKACNKACRELDVKWSHFQRVFEKFKPNAVLIWVRQKSGPESKLPSRELQKILKNLFLKIHRSPNDGVWGEDGEKCLVRMFLTATEAEWQAITVETCLSAAVGEKGLRSGQERGRVEVVPRERPVSGPDKLDDDIQSLRKEILSLRDENWSLRDENKSLREENARLRQVSDRNTPHGEVLEEVQFIRKQVEALAKPKNAATLWEGLTPTQRDVLEAIRQLPSEAMDEASMQLATLKGQPFTAAFAKSFSSILREKKWLVQCGVCQVAAAVYWHADSRYDEGGYAFFSHLSAEKSGARVHHGSSTKIPRLKLVNRINQRWNVR